MAAVVADASSGCCCSLALSMQQHPRKDAACAPGASRFFLNQKKKRRVEDLESLSCCSERERELLVEKKWGRKKLRARRCSQRSTRVAHFVFFKPVERRRAKKTKAKELSRRSKQPRPLFLRIHRAFLWFSPIDPSACRLHDARSRYGAEAAEEEERERGGESEFRALLAPPLLLSPHLSLRLHSSSLLLLLSPSLKKPY